MTSSDPERAPAPRLSRLARAVGLVTLESASLGLWVWALISHSAVPSYAGSNAIPSSTRHYVLFDMLIAVAVGWSILTALYLRRRAEGLDVIERAARRCAPLSVVGLAAFLFDVRLWQDREIVFLALAAVFGFGVRSATRVFIETPAVFPRLGARVRAALTLVSGRGVALVKRWDLPLLVVVAAALSYAAYFSIITINNHRNLGTCSFDLGLEDNLMWNLVHGSPIFKSTPFDGPSGTHLRNHATFFAYVMAPIYRAVPGPETLLVVQAVMMGAAAVPLHLYARKHVSPWIATVPSLLYLVYPPLHGANLYDFHYLPLGVPLLWLVLYAVETRRWILVVVMSLLALSVREDVAFCLGVLGLYLLMSGKSARAGVALAGVGLGYFLVMKLVVMPHFGVGGESFLNQYAGLIAPGGHGFGDVLETVLANPVFTSNVVLERDKLLYFLQLLVPLLFLPLLRPIGLLLVLPGFLFTLLNTGYGPLDQISFQYTSYWSAFVFVGIVLELERARTLGPGPARQRAVVVGLVAASLACTNLYGAIFHRDSVRGGFERARIASSDVDLGRRADLATLVAQIPADAKVCASEHLLPHVSTRESAYTMRFGRYDADYLLFQLPLRADERDNALKPLRDGTFGVIDDRSDMVLAKRGAPSELNAAILKR